MKYADGSTQPTLPLATDPRARLTDPDTSHEAATSVENVRESQMAVYAVLRVLGGATDEELFAALGKRGVKMSVSGARTRRSELVKAGYVLDSGERKRTKAGRRTIVWVTSA